MQPRAPVSKIEIDVVARRSFDAVSLFIWEGHVCRGTDMTARSGGSNMAMRRTDEKCYTVFETNLTNMWQSMVFFCFHVPAVAKAEL